MKRVVITGLGAVTPLGVGVQHSWNQLIAGNSGLVSTVGWGSQWDSIPCKVVGKVPEGSIADHKWDSSDHFTKSESNRLALFAQYAMTATAEAFADSRMDLLSVDKRRVGVNVGSGIGSFHDAYDNSVNFHEHGYKRVQPLFIPKLLTNMAAGNISIKYGLQGPNHSVATACATGLHAIGDAYNFIRNGYSDVMVSGSAESSIHPLALAGFARARSVVGSFNDDPQRASRPFDKDRNGFVLGEGSGILILESLDHALQRGVQPHQIYAEVAGYGLSGDGFHITAPPESGEGAQLAMEMALKHAEIDPQNVDYINAHATSTKIGDIAENNAIFNIFHQNGHLSVSSTKSSIGHLLGAAGSVESIFTILAMKHDTLPPTLNLENLEQNNRFVFDYVPQKSRSKQIGIAMNNSFGFGGVNSSVVFTTYIP
ncbi:3-oxoacyl-synthase [Yamadazyma tenuis ATCC 10573]|uniref:3-oxoacyl-[acyl-carrier-protein] synthase n=1 Tax=Candida tenuis (strain ATCC 10573 / BCRC 21748 / CBS 615 / JCM 9827 / NBRC 10315 / NRRL Y-1498 / VKM Y-70) TaxID=590646 RepID=G3B824_CANTC|nr:3-oxoacyl-synthase [Yamadazyma tenuis ATCC 10573]EGV62335.1 3-oxoacyl-synthase [Yamadazyma tenuis ATCC 10573]